MAGDGVSQGTCDNHYVCTALGTCLGNAIIIAGTKTLELIRIYIINVNDIKIMDHKQYLF